MPLLFVPLLPLHLLMPMLVPLLPAPLHYDINYDIVSLLPLQLLVPLLSLSLLPPLLLPLLPLLLLPLHFKLLGKEPQNLKILLYDNFILAF